MISYVTFGTSDLKRAAAFYDELFSVLNAKRVFEIERMIGWGTGESPMLVVTKPFDGNAATVGNGVMVALAVPSQEIVDKVYAKAISLGGKDEGKPGDRGGGFYAGYFRDLDGNKLNAIHMGS